MKYKVCDAEIGDDSRDSLVQEHCWRHVTGGVAQPSLPVEASLPKAIVNKVRPRVRAKVQTKVRTKARRPRR